MGDNVEAHFVFLLFSFISSFLFQVYFFIFKDGRHQWYGYQETMERGLQMKFSTQKFLVGYQRLRGDVCISVFSGDVVSLAIPVLGALFGFLWFQFIP